MTEESPVPRNKLDSVPSQKSKCKPDDSSPKDEAEGQAEDFQRPSVSISNREDAEGDEDEELLFPGFVSMSMRYFSQQNKLRYGCLKIITWPYPFLTILLMIIFPWRTPC